MPDILRENTHGYYLEDLSIGMIATCVKTMTEEDLVRFAEISGDIDFGA